MAYKIKTPMWSPNYWNVSNKKVGFGIHHAVALTLESIGRTFQSVAASTIWGVTEGAIMQYLKVNTYQYAISDTWGNAYLENIEVCNDAVKPPYPISKKKVDTLVEFMADRCNANGWKSVRKSKNKNDRPTADDTKNKVALVFWHNQFAQTSCPGVLEKQIDDICKRVNALLKPATTAPAPTTVLTNAKIAKEIWSGKCSWSKYNTWGNDPTRSKRINEYAKLVGKTGITPAKVAAEIEKLRGDTAPAPSAPSEYIVKFGDTLGAISKSVGVSVAKIISLNKAKYPDLEKYKGDRIYAGWRLKLK
jgi:LysM repeat protein